MYWVKITNPHYEQSQRYVGEVGEVVGRWGPDSNAAGREGYLVEFADGEIIGVADDEIGTISESELETPDDSGGDRDRTGRRDSRGPSDRRPPFRT